MEFLSETLTSSWELQFPREIRGKEVYERPLGLLEQGFYWDSIFERTADTLQHAEFIIDTSRVDYKQAASYANVARVWMQLKQQFPLLGARIEERDEKSIFFVVAAESLQQCRPEEVVFQDVGSSEEAGKVMENIIVKGRRLSNALLAQLLILRRTDAQNIFHVMFHVAHVITDGIANITILKTFLDEVACDGRSRKFWDLRQRLALSESTDNLYPQIKFSIAKQRWRWASARIIAARRPPPSTRQAGHSLPRKVSQQTPYTPAHSKKLAIAIPLKQSQAIISNCRQHKLTFGNVYPIIGQIAVTRLLLKLYLRGEISEEEWAFRKREPMFSAGPLNLRIFQDKAWLAAGGSDHVCVSIGFFFYSLPVMPLGKASSLLPGAALPSFGTLLSRKRFWLRSQSIRKQADKFMRNPLLLELGALALPGRVKRARDVAIQWRNAKGPPTGLNGRLMSPMEQALAGLVFCNGGSSMGNIDLLLPREYPLSKKGAEPPAIVLKTNSTMLHCRPTELYLGASTSAQLLRLSVYWDNNIFEEDLIAEWLEEVKNAVDFYLGQDAAVRTKL